MRRRDLLKAIPLLMTPALARADTLPLRFIPNANLTSLDPIWTTALVAQAHGYLVYDTLYGIDASNKLQPQMCAGHDVSADDVDLDVHVARRARIPRRRKGPGEGLRDVAEALGLAQFVRPAIDKGGE